LLCPTATFFGEVELSHNFLDGTNDPRETLRALIGFARNPWTIYTKGYLDAANELVASLEALQGRRGKVDFYVYPIAFLYRHHIELSIKRLYLMVCHYLGTKPTLITSHTLLNNWQDFKANLLVAAQNNDMMTDTQQFVTQVEAKLNQFVTLDRSSMTFRYPVDKDGQSLLAGRKHLHVGQLKDFANDLASDLESLDLELSAWLDIQSDWYATMASSFEDEEDNDAAT